MGFFEKITKPFKMYKAFREFKRIQTAPSRSEESYILLEEDRKAGLEMRQLNAEKRRIERRRAFLERQAEIMELAQEVDELEREVYGEEEEQPTNQKMSIEDMFLTNIFTAMKKNQDAPKQKTLNSYYPTGTTDENIQFTTGEQEQSPIPDEEIKKFLSFLNPQQAEFLGKLPKSTISRAHDLLNFK